MSKAKIKKILKNVSYVLYILAIIDFCLGIFFNIDITGVFWSPLAFGVLGFLLGNAAIYLVKPENLSQTLDGTIEKSVTLYDNFSNENGKLYVSTDKIIFDGEVNTIEIPYEKIKKITKARAVFLFPAILITLKDGKEYLFGMLTGRDVIFDAIQTNLNKSFNSSYN